MTTRCTPQLIGDLLRDVLKESNMERHLLEVRAAEMWPRIVGSGIASRCKSAYCADGVLTIATESTVLRQELAMRRTPLREAINRALGAEVVREIVFKSQV